MSGYNRLTLTTRWCTGLLALCGCVVAFAGVVWMRATSLNKPFTSLRVTVVPERLRADGYDTAVLSIESVDSNVPSISLQDPIHGVAIEEISGGAGRWYARIRVGIVPGRIDLRIESSEHPVAHVQLTAELDDRDSAGDGTPDFLRLDSEHDEQTFLRWFTYLAEAQYFQSEAARSSEIKDCAALIRYAYREALRIHDAAWANSVQLPLVPAFGTIGKYQYPFTPLGASLFRVRAFSFQAKDLTDGAFLQFADARTLWRFNTHLVSRDLAAALPADLLFFRQVSDRVTFHSMIYLGRSQWRPDGRSYVVYHTGPDGSDPGEIRRLTVEELERFPQPEWRPVIANPNFLGVARWNILRRGTNEPESWSR
jgi:uncharacterized protein